MKHARWEAFLLTRPPPSDSSLTLDPRSLAKRAHRAPGPPELRLGVDGTEQLAKEQTHLVRRTRPDFEAFGYGDHW